MSRTARFENDEVAKGYFRANFEEDFESYLGVSSGTPRDLSVTPLQSGNINDLGAECFHNVKPDVTDQSGDKPLEVNDCYVVTAENPPLGEKGLFGHSCAYCRGPPDGSEQRCSFGGADDIWLHRRCENAFVAQKEEGGATCAS